MDIIFESIGYLAGICTALSFIPQAFKTYKIKNVQGLSVSMYGIFNLALICWIIYGIYLSSWQMIIFNTLCLSFSLPILIMVFKYSHHK